jgi:hypothetical protein
MVLLILVFTIQSTNRNLLFERLGFVTFLVVDYYSSILNIIYMISAIYIMKVKVDKDLRTMKKVIKTVLNCLYILLISIMLYLYFIPQIQIKTCFLGSCLMNNSVKYFAQILPVQIECCIVFFLLLLYMGIFISNTNLSNGVFETFNDSNGFIRIFLFELLYFLFNFTENYAKYQKVVKQNNYRFEDYFSIHDFKIVVKSFLLFMCLGLTMKNLKEWEIAFNEDLTTLTENDERIIEEIKGIKHYLEINLRDKPIII